MESPHKFFCGGDFPILACLDKALNSIDLILKQLILNYIVLLVLCFLFLWLNYVDFILFLMLLFYSKQFGLE